MAKFSKELMPNALVRLFPKHPINDGSVTQVKKNDELYLTELHKWDVIDALFAYQTFLYIANLFGNKNFLYLKIEISTF